LLAIVEKCDKQCYNCEATMVWGLSIMDCLKFQLKFELIELPQQHPPKKDSLEEAQEILSIFHRFSMIDAYSKFPHVYGLIPHQPEK